MNLQNHSDYSGLSAECKSWALNAPAIEESPGSFAKDTGVVCAFLKQGIQLQHPKHGFDGDIGFVGSVCDELRNKFLGFYRGSDPVWVDD